MKKLILLFLFISGFSFAQENVKVDLTNPSATIYTHLYFLQDSSYNASKAAKTIRGYTRKEAIDKSIKIKEVLDGKGLIIDFSNIPENRDFIDTISGIHAGLDKPKHRFYPFPNRMPEIYVEKTGNYWYYSKETVENIDQLYTDTFPWQFTYLQKKFPKLFHQTAYNIKIWKPIGFLLLIILCIVLFFILDKIIFYFLKKTQELIIRRPSLKSFDVLHELTRPIALIIIIEVVEVLLPSLQLFRINDFLFMSLDIAKTVFWVFVFLKLMKVVLSIYKEYSEKTITKLDEQLAPILKKVSDGIIILIGLLHVLTLFGVDPITVLTGASIGGIAIAFAAQDSVKNLIGTIVIFLDNPFHIGDWIEMGEAVGTVERVGLRSTMVRGLDTSIYQVPNSIISESVINNKGLRIYRRYTTELGIRYDTPPELIEAFVKGLRELIVAHPETRSESYNVEFTGFGDSALLILLNVYFMRLDWGSEQSSKHRLHIAIVKLAAALNVEFAFPSSTLMIEQFPDKNSITMKYNTNTKYINQSIKSVLSEFKEVDHQQGSNVSTRSD